jgi:hypothetical protein
VRYSFHGKMRFTGQSVDGYIDAPNSMQAIDLLADEGVIGVYTVNPAPLSTKPRLTYSGMEALDWSSPVESEAEPLVDRLAALIGQVEQILASRPMLSVPVRSGTSSSQKSKTKPFADEQTAALRAIFQTNLELRRSIGQLASSAAIQPNPKVQSNASHDLMISVPQQPAA